jgi:exopolysaccharide biosynthesis polyprenyl glycosylphosphotransferase
MTQDSQQLDPKGSAVPLALKAGGPRGGVTLNRELLNRVLLGAADLISAALALLLAVQVLGDDRLNSVALVVVPTVLLISKAAGLYDRDEPLLRRATLDEAGALFRVATFYTFVIWLLQDFFIFGQGAFGSDQLLTLWALLFGGILAARAVARRLARALAPPERCLLLGGDTAARSVERKLAECRSANARLVAQIPFWDRHPDQPGEVEAAWQEALPMLVEEHAIDRVILAPSRTDGEAVVDAISSIRAMGVKVSVLPRLLEVVGWSVELDELDGVTLLAVHRYGLSRSSRALKRGVDVVGSALGLIFLAPLFAAVALAIKLDTKGSVFFRQRRMGRDDEHFEMLKFRTMVEGAHLMRAELEAQNESEGLFKIADDPRITRIGRLLRRSSLDELPQLWNVLRGEMSLVGPRPLVIEEDALVEGWRRGRLLVRPGMTGLWQIYGSARIPLQEMVKIDYLYGANWSLWLDAKVLLRTVPFVLSRRGL